MASLQTLMQDYDQHLARLEELRGLLEERLAAARADLAAAVAAGSATLAGLARRESAAIESALDRMDRGRYGTCLRCGALIPYGELRRTPHEQLCPACRGTRAKKPARAATEIPAPRTAPSEDSVPSLHQAVAPPGREEGSEAGTGT
ncbi:MAG TPA: hypothetical protein VKZ82_19560 [Nonomuraea sp.]|uniref:TraR/DksA family transcriptional regulator n=1 Tax=Nonomuraea sp. NPDC049649 TaxID=3155776 RepID=UPI002BED11A4|nr:hypothetical protein [Nonomuraea sp.]